MPSLGGAEMCKRDTPRPARKTRRVGQAIAARAEGESPAATKPKPRATNARRANSSGG